MSTTTTTNKQEERKSVYVIWLWLVGRRASDIQTSGKSFMLNSRSEPQRKSTNESLRVDTDLDSV